MNQAVWKKLGVGSLALTLVLSASSLSIGSRFAHAAETGIQAEQANASGSKDEKDGHKHARKWPIVEEAAGLIGVDKETMVRSLKSGKSIVDIASEKGVSEADLTAKLQKLRTGKIDAAVKDGKLTAEQGEHLKQKLGEHLKNVLNEKNLFESMRERGAWNKHGHGLRPDSEKLAQALGMSKDELKAQRKAGKSLAEIAQSKGISKDKLVQTIKDQLTPSIEKMVDCKKGSKKE